MPTSYPTSLDAFTNPTSSDPPNSPSHAGQHADENDAIEALEAKVGIDGSADTASLDYRVAQLEAAGGGSVAPDTPSGLKFWLKADAIIGLSDNDPVGTWEDSSTSNNDFTQSNASKKPLYKTNQKNGLPVVRFDNSDDGLLSGYSRSAYPITVLVVYKQLDTNTSAHRVLQGSSNPWIIGPYQNNESFYFAGGQQFKVQQGGSWVLMAARLDATKAQCYLDGRLIGVADVGTPGTLGLGVEGAFAEPADSDVAEVIFYDTYLSHAHFDGVMEYLRAKWALW